MTVQSTTRRNIYRGNGSTTSFPITFPFSSSADIFVFVADASGISEATSNFNISGNNVVYPRTGEPLADGHKITIMRTVDLVQLLNLVNQGPFFAEDIESAFDYLTYALQQVADDVKRSVILDVSEERGAGNLVLPKAPNKSFKWNGDATQLVLTDDPADVLPQVIAARDTLLLRPGYLAVEANITKITNVADDLPKIESVLGNMSYIRAINSNLTYIWRIGDNLEAVLIVADDIYTIRDVHANIAVIESVRNNLTAVKTVNENMPALRNINDNMDDIKASADNAALAKKYAVGVPEEPEGHSAKWWAEFAESVLDQADWEETDTTKKSFIKNKPGGATTGKEGFVKILGELPGSDIFSYKELANFGYDITWNKVEEYNGIVVAIGNNGAVIRSTDGGKTWDTPIYLDGAPNLTCMTFATRGTDITLYVGSREQAFRAENSHIAERLQSSDFIVEEQAAGAVAVADGENANEIQWFGTEYNAAATFSLFMLPPHPSFFAAGNDGRCYYIPDVISETPPVTRFIGKVGDKYIKWVYIEKFSITYGDTDWPQNLSMVGYVEVADGLYIRKQWYRYTRKDAGEENIVLIAGEDLGYDENLVCKGGHTFRFSKRGNYAIYTDIYLMPDGYDTELHLGSGNDAIFPNDFCGNPLAGMIGVKEGKIYKMEETGAAVGAVALRLETDKVKIIAEQKAEQKATIIAEQMATAKINELVPDIADTRATAKINELVPTILQTMSEVWTFTLEDETTVTKKVVIASGS